MKQEDEGLDETSDSKNWTGLQMVSLRMKSYMMWNWFFSIVGSHFFQPYLILQIYNERFSDLSWWYEAELA